MPVGHRPRMQLVYDYLGKIANTIVVIVNALNCCATRPNKTDGYYSDIGKSAWQSRV